MAAQPHLPGFGEFNGVAHQVQQHLPQAVGVAEYRGQGGGLVEAQAQMLFAGARAQQGRAAAQQLVGAERSRLGLQLAGPQPGSRQHVVENREQVLGRLAQQAQVVVLAAAERGFGQHARQAQNAVQRRPNLVAHVGQKVFLGPGIDLGRRNGGLQGLLGVLELRDVAVDTQHLALAVGTHKKPFHAVEPERGAIREQQGFLQGQVLAGAQHLLVLLLVACPVGGGHQPGGHAYSAQLIGGHAKQGGHGLVGQQVAAGGVFQVHGVGQGIDNLAEQAVLLGQVRGGLFVLFVGGPALGNVFRYPEQVQHPAFRIAHEGNVRGAQPAQRAVAVVQAVFEGARFPVGHLGHLGQVLCHQPQREGRQHRFEKLAFGKGQQFVAGVAQQLLGVAVGVRIALLRQVVYREQVRH